MKRLIYVLFLLPLFAQAQEVEKLSPRTRIALADYEKAQRGDSISIRRLRTQKTERIVNAYVRLNDEYSVEDLREAGVSVGTVAAGMATVRLPISKVSHIAAMPAVRYLEIAPEARPRMDLARADVKADAVHNATDGLSEAYKGKDVVVGIIDNGFEYGHVNFYSADRSQFRVKRVWNQSLKNGSAPEGFSYGTEHTTKEAILTALRDSTLSTHGTHVAGIAAGAMATEDGKNYAGIAPEADIVLVSLSEDEMANSSTSLVVDAINYIYSYAASVGKPAVVNISLGTHLGPHDGTSAFDRMTDALQGPGRLLVGSVGNEGADRFHVSKTFKSGTTTPDTLRTFPEFYYPTYQFSDLEVWGEEGKTLSVRPVIYRKSASTAVSDCETITIAPDLQATSKEFEFTQDEDGITGKVLVQSEINPDNNKPHIVVSMFFYAANDLRPGIHFTSPDDQTVHVWSDNIYSKLTADNEPGYTEGDADYSMGELGGTGKRIISVGAHTTRDHRFNYGIYYPSKFGDLNDIASFSSHGPTVDGRIKPDVSAPGVYLISSFSSYYTGSKYRESPINWNGKKYEARL